MSNLSAAQIASYAKEAGFTGNGLTTITAIALAESGGNPGAVCNNCAGVKENSIGLTQINTLAHPQYTTSTLLNPYQNMLAAYQVSNGGTNFNPWTTYTNKSYLSHLAEVEKAVLNLPTTILSEPLLPSGPPISNKESLLNAIGNSISSDAKKVASNLDPLSKIYNFFSNIHWFSILEILTGIIGVIFGFIFLMNAVSNSAISTNLVKASV